MIKFEQIHSRSLLQIRANLLHLIWTSICIPAMIFKVMAFLTSVGICHSYVHLAVLAQFQKRK
jgi:hypothetical protein